MHFKGAVALSGGRIHHSVYAVHRPAAVGVCVNSTPPRVDVCQLIGDRLGVPRAGGTNTARWLTVTVLPAVFQSLINSQICFGTNPRLHFILLRERV